MFYTHRYQNPMGIVSYFTRVFVPGFSKKSTSYSSYDRKSEFRLQLLFWAVLLLALGVFGFHVRGLIVCNGNRFGGMCGTNLYSWLLYTLLLGGAWTAGILLHYGYVDPVDKEADDFYDTDIEQFDNSMIYST